MNRGVVQRSWRVTSAIVFVSSLVPRAALACPVCFSGGEGQATRGLWWGVLTLVFITTGVLGACASFAVRLARRERGGSVRPSPSSLGAGGRGRLPASDHVRDRPAGQPQPEATT